MKKLDLSQITGSTGMPLKKGTLLHIIESQREVVDALAQGLTAYTTGNVIILYGCVITGTNPGVISNTAGAVYYNGEVYLVDAQTFTTTGSNIPCWTIFETSVSGLGYDTVLLTDASSGYIHKDRKFKLVNSPIGGSGVLNYVADFNTANVRRLNGIWKNITVFTAGYTASGLPPQYKLQANGLVIFRGWVDYNSPATSTITTLPSEITPPQNASGLHVAAMINSASLVKIAAQSNSELQTFNAAILTGSGQISLDNFRYSII